MRDFYKNEKKNCTSISVFDYENKEKCLFYMSKNILKKCFNLLILEGNDKNHYIAIKNF